MDDLVPIFLPEGELFVGNDFIPICFLEEYIFVGMITGYFNLCKLQVIHFRTKKNHAGIKIPAWF